jgi:ParB-like chromosome segregation protein Spo0J
VDGVQLDGGGYVDRIERERGLGVNVEIRPIKGIGLAKYNPRKISDQALDSLVQSIERFGFVDPVIVNDRTGILVGGHQRLKAAKKLGLKDVPVVAVSLDEAEEKALNVALNKISGEWDLDLLRGVLEDVQAAGLDLSLTGFGEQEIESLLTQSGEIDYSVLDGAVYEDRLQELAEGVKRSLVVEFENNEEYEEAAETAKRFRADKVDMGAIFLKGLREHQ